jgi:hypothetical protein
MDKSMARLDVQEANFAIRAVLGRRRYAWPNRESLAVRLPVPRAQVNGVLRRCPGED